jgi:radical SAM family uncharacterized protein/radical SAM-linked protein
MSEAREKILLERILPDVEKPGRYIGGEWNAVRKDPAAAQLKIGLVFPDVYEIGMSYLGQKILYSIINAQPSFLAERIFAPWPDMERALRKHKEPLRSLENGIPGGEFDILGFSLLYELNYSNILTVLDLSGIPFLAGERKPGHPLVIAGGPAAFNPEPTAEIFDLFLIGDGEEAVLEIISRAAELKQGGASRSVIKKDLAGIRGVYVPSLYASYRAGDSPLLAVRPTAGAPPHVEKRVLRAFARSYFPEEIIVPNVQTVFDRVAVEVARGCPHKCRFCQATSLYAPYRVKDPTFVVDKIFGSLRATGYEDASLFSLSVSDYPYLGETVKSLMEGLEKDHVALSLSSLRPKGLSADIVRNIIKVRKTGFTLVPEAGSERLRRVINKNLTDKDLWDAAANAYEEGWRLLKLYVMIGLPTETEEDLSGIGSLVEGLSDLGRRILGSPPHINLSVSSFIPKPHTPFQWEAMEDETTLRDKQIFLRRILKRMGNVQVKDQPLESSFLEAVFSRGDRRLSEVLQRAWSGGARFDSWRDHFRFNLWRDAFAGAGIDGRPYSGPLPRSAVLPWDHIRTGVKKEFLSAEHDKALRAEESPSCLETSCGRCLGCEFLADLERSFKKKVESPVPLKSFLGYPSEMALRYQAFYEKSGSARFASHNDLVNILQRSLKRAGIEVHYTEGFHPKMQMSLVPALPLGMVGRRESFEYKSSYAVEQEDFLASVNRSVPPGIRFSGLTRVETRAPSLTDRIEAFIYSIDLSAEKMRDALARAQEGQNLKGGDDDVAERLVRDYLERKHDLIEDIRVERAAGRVVIRIRYDTRRPLRIQDVAEQIYGLTNAVDIMSRDTILFRH